jgi:hypothetical protein
MRNMAARLGFDLAYSKGNPPPDDAVGILDLDRGADGHVVMWLKGIIFNPADGELWTDAEAFIHRGGWTIVGLLWRIQ